MNNLVELTPATRHTELAKLITTYNQLNLERPSNVDDHTELRLWKNQQIDKVFLLQKINYFIETAIPDTELTKWRTASGRNSWEDHLQRYSIARDGSLLVKNIQFADAITLYDTNTPSDDLDYFHALQARNALLAKPGKQLDDEEKAKYVQYNQTIMHKFYNDPVLQERFKNSQYFLSLCYAKMEAIHGVVDQEFEIFNTNYLGERTRNNRNFTLEIAGEEKQLVLRVEDRNSLVNEQQLQTYPVSDYFSEDYYMMMQPFKEGYLVTYRPVVLSEYVEKGSLDNYAESLAEESPEDLRQKTQNIFSQLSDFCIKLMEAGHYHPDIKLSNFLTDGRTIKVSDRKTIIDKRNPNGTEIRVTFTYAPPEYQPCINKTKTGINSILASRITLDMPSLMSYQLGMALKEFMMASYGMERVSIDMFMQWVPINVVANDPSRTQKNLFALVQELTRSAPQDRLSIAHFQALLKKIHLPHVAFLAEIESLSPQASLSHAAELDLMQQMLRAPKLTPQLSQQWRELTEKGISTELYSDPRMGFFTCATKEIETYLERIDSIISLENRKKASSLRLVGSFLGVPIPEVTKIEELPALPVMPDKIKWYYEILEEMQPNMLDVSTMAKLKHIQLREAGMLQIQIASPKSDFSSQTTSPNESPYSSPIEKSNSDEFDDVGEQVDSGSFVRVPIDHQKNEVEDVSAEYGNGSFRHVPIAPQAEQLHPNSLQEKKHNLFNAKKAINMMREEGQIQENKIEPPPKATDIDSAIQRGNKRAK